MLAELGRGHAHDTQERSRPDLVSRLVGGRAGLRVDLPQQPGRREIGQAQSAVQGVVAGVRHGPTPGLRLQELEPKGQHHARFGAAHRDGPGQAVTPRLGEHRRPDLTRRLQPLEIAGCVQRPDDHRVPGVDRQHRCRRPGEVIDGGPRLWIEMMHGHSIPKN